MCSSGSVFQAPIFILTRGAHLDGKCLEKGSLGAWDECRHTIIHIVHIKGFARPGLSCE